MNDLNDKEPPHFEVPLNEEIFARATDMKSQRATLESRLSKIEQSQGTVSSRVYQKVLKEYQDQMAALTHEMSTLKNDIEQEIDNLAEQKMLAELALRDMKEALEEMQLRHELGEVEERDFKIEREKKQSTLERIQKELATLESHIGKYKVLFPEETLAKPPVAPKKESHSKVKEKDESDYIYLSDELVDEPEEGAIEEDKIEGVEEAPAEESPYQEELAPRVIVKEKGVTKQELNLGSGTIFIGRSPSNQVPLPDPKISRKHAAIDFKNEHYILSDLGSSNGTFVDGKKIKEHTLEDGDEIKIGSYTLFFKA